jgi:glycosyltransferase involved in cell wall biosynthesis
MNKATRLPCEGPICQSGVNKSFTLSILIPVYNERHIVAASIKRCLTIKSELIHDLEFIVVDDCSTDGTWEVLQRLASEDQRIVLMRNPRNLGKGAAVRQALSRASGDITIIHDGDLEYNPADIPALLVPFAEEGADAVFGSRFLSSSYRRALMHRHTAINKTLTAISNWLTDLSLTDLETCYKAINTTLFKSIPLRSNDFRFEVEVTFKLAKRHARVFEVPIRYLPRTHEEGKKIAMWDGLLAIQAMLHYWLVDDLYGDDEYGSQMLVELERATRFNVWMANTLRPHLGDRVLEIGAGIGTLTSQFIPRELYVASDLNPSYLHYLRSFSFGKPYLHVAKIDVTNAHQFRDLEGRFDTVLMINVLEHVSDPAKALRNVHLSLERGGRAVVLVPQEPSLYGSLDEALEHRERYTSETLAARLGQSGFAVETVFDFNRSSVPAWWLNGKLLRRKRFSRVHLKILDTLIPALRRIDSIWPWKGMSLIGVGVKEAGRRAGGEP